MEQNKPAFAQRCEALANDEKACHEAYNNQYHKVRAEVGFDDWRSVWRFLLICALPTLLKPEGEQEPGAPVAYQGIVSAIRAVGDEAARRGAMFPQTRDEQEEDKRAVRRVAEMIEWYATAGGAVATSLPGWPKHPAQPAEGDEVTRLKRTLNDLGKIIHDMTVAQQAAWIEWQHGKGAEEAMSWIHNGLVGPGFIPDEDEPYGKEAQAYFDANRSDPFPICYCGRPSNSLWMGQGFCCREHYDTRRTQIEAQQQAGKEG